MRLSTMGTLRDNSLPATPRRIRMIASGEILDFYLGLPYKIAPGVMVLPGNYVGRRVVLSHQWVMQNPSNWEMVAEPFPVINT